MSHSTKLEFIQRNFIDNDFKHLVALEPGSKRPLRTIDSWKPYEENAVPFGQMLAWWGRLGNADVGLFTLANGIAVLDWDEEEKGREFFRNYRGIIKTIVKTGRGLHSFHKHPGPQFRTRKGDGYDLKTTGYVKVPPADDRYFVEGFEMTNDLPPLPEEFLKQPAGFVAAESCGNASRIERITRAAAYAATMDPAISGQHGHNTLMRFAGAMIQKFGLSIEEAWAIALRYNERCVPAWSEKQLLRKLQEAERLKMS